MRSIAFPSWVTAGDIAHNASFICNKWQELELAGKFGPGVQSNPEIGLCFFEHLACTAYTGEDLPQHLAHLPASWHVHLPLDLPLYSSGGLAQAQLSFDICNELMQKVEFLGVKQAVLHPVLAPAFYPVSAPAFYPGLAPASYPVLAPASYPVFPSGQNEGLGASLAPKFCKPLQSEACLNSLNMLKFIDLWEDSGRKRADLLLENRPGDDLTQLFKLAQVSGCGLCLDLAHLYMPAQNGQYAATTGRPLYAHASDLAPTSAPFFASGHNSPFNVGASPAFSLHSPPSKLCAQKQELLNPDFLQMLQMVHLNAAGKKQSGHASLACLLPEAQGEYQKIISLLPQNSTLMLELFKWQQIEESIPFLASYLS